MFDHVQCDHIALGEVHTYSSSNHVSGSGSRPQPGVCIVRLRIIMFMFPV